MKLTLNGHEHEFVPIKNFRESHGLPDNFGVALFEPKDFSGLAALDEAGSEMNQLRQGILDSVPAALALSDLLTVANTLQATFRAGLYGINDRIALKVVEVDFAVAGFGDVLRNWAYALLRAHSSRTDPPAFQTIYHDWLNSSVRLSGHVHDYPHQGQSWQVQIVNHAYGRAGLRVAHGDAVSYVADGIYACPAEGYMLGLLGDVAARLALSLP